MPLSPSQRRRRKEVEPEIYDRSYCEGYSNCPYQAVHGQGKSPGMLAQVGIEGHKIIAEAWEFCEGDSESASKYMMEELPKARPDIQPEVIVAVKNFAERMKEFAPWKFLGVEKQYSCEYFEGAIITTALDLLIGGADETKLHVHDWKTGWKRYTNDIAQNCYQTCHGSVILFDIHPEVNTLFWWYDQTRQDISPGFARIDRERDYDNFRGRIGSCIQLAQSGSEEAWPEPAKCSWCDITGICPHATKEAFLLGDNEPDYLKRFIALQAHVSAMKKTMDAKYKQTGMLIKDGRGNTYGDQGRGKIINKLGKEKVEARNG